MVIEERHNVVAVSGALTRSQWPIIRTTAFLVYERIGSGVIIDFSGVRWLSSAGESTLIDAMNEIERCRLPFTILTVSNSAAALLSDSVARRLTFGTERWWSRMWGTE